MFLTNLVVERNIEKDYSWIVAEPLVWEDDAYHIIIKPGFESDFASVPWLFRRVIPKEGQEYDRAACLHDALYLTELLPREEADKLFYDAMLIDGVSIFRAKLMWAAARYFGWIVWNAHDPKNVMKAREYITCTQLSV